ncbi:restriction system modified-DNA reader domain-containing protein [Botrimarina hoheduenensis]|uniref:RAMA domain-containing protein n=1 Tax=Botrimarina hoheduenensis TaxID=2528000 RepID=A0A5C5VV44_9BACT|nr:restriction endonuclease [Botrimarina hoheduenensis]TWT41529.1 hypothetical protein Pla111_29050 [Botrimarina hoheduenensis]
MGELVDEIRKVKQRIEKYGVKGINEQDTKATLIQPILRTLGWDVEDLEDVQREYKPRKQDKPVDYALMLLRTPCLFVEAKALGQNLDDRKWASQFMGYAGVAGVRWVALTDGNEYRLYNTHAAVPVEEKLFRSVKITDSIEDAAATLCLLSRDRMQGNEIDSLWNAFFIDKQVRSAIDELLLDGGDAALMRILSKRLPNLANKDIRASLRRAEVTVSFPVAPTDSPDSPLKRKPPAKARRKPSRQTPKRPRSASGQLIDMGVQKRQQLSVLMEHGYVAAGQELLARYRGADISATITKAGKVKFDGAEYESLSAAGAAAKSVYGGGGHLATDGWTFWQTAVDGGSVVPMKAIRSNYLSKK